MEQFDTLPIQYRHIEHMHEGVWLNFFWTKWQQFFHLYGFCICTDIAFMGRLTPPTAFDETI